MNSTEMISKMKNGAFDFNDSKIKTAFALNLCTVSVSQIIDYKDIVVLEQEYDAILNNLNLESIPKDEALLKILKQLLDTITFFRMQEGDKAFIDREYQNKMKNAIWNAVPNFGVIFAGGKPLTLAVSLASQVGIGYMNYRKAKAENNLDYEKKLWELQKSAIEQFNGLRRELFDTAWRLVDAHEIPDAYRLTERQVTQYNEILMDPDAFRRYERLDTIKENFVAYPPFWYFFGNTANELALETTGELSAFYTDAAKLYYEVFIRAFGACDLLRENQIASACALEYIDLLNPKNEMEKKKIEELLPFALKYSGNANDVLQLCAFSYMKIGAAADAARLFRRLVNEDYNPIVNAQLLSKYYVSDYLTGNNQAVVGYQYLQKRMDEKYLYPFPTQAMLEKHDDIKALESVQSEFLENQKEILAKKTAIVIERFKKAYTIEFNRCIPVPDDKEYTDNYYDESVDAFAARKADGSELRKKGAIALYVSMLQDVDYPYNYLQVLNDMLNATDLFNFTQGHSGELLEILSKSIIANRQMLLDIKKKIDDDSFDAKTYDTMIEISFDTFCAPLFEKLSEYATDYIAQREDIVSMNDAESNLRDFCIKQGYETPDELYDTSYDIVETLEFKKQYLSIDLIEDGVMASERDGNYEEMAGKIVKFRDKVNAEDKGTVVLMQDQEEFERYFVRLSSVPNKHKLQRKTVAIIDDRSEADNDLIFTIDGIVQIVKGKMKEALPFDKIQILSDNTGLMIRQTYKNAGIDMADLIELIKSLRENEVMEVYEPKSNNPVDMVMKLFKW
ncbi:MAG: hypothetical protein IKO61_01895 [Lachnospiraceae bacterium]|nr:hypothetical protein [Lachnospiraceae bacterium]